MIPIQKMLIDYNYSTGNKVEYIVIHDTGNTSKGANALAHYNYFNGGNRGASASYFVDDTNIIQTVEDFNASWHCGDGGGKYGITNYNSIGIEICINSDGNYDKAVNNAIDLVKHLMKKYNISIDKVVRHYDSSRKSCPNTMSANNWAKWNWFKDQLIKSNSFIKLDGGGTIKDGKPALNLIIRDYSDDIKRIFGTVDSDKGASWAFDLVPPNDNYTKLFKNTSKVINTRNGGDTFSPNANYKIKVVGYGTNSNILAEQTIVLKTKEEEKNVIYRVQVGAFRDKANADKLLKELELKKFEGFIRE